MALSDACFEFIEAVADAAGELGREAHRYSDPSDSWDYGAEIDALRRACVAVRDAPYDPEAGARLLRLAVSVMRFHDVPPVAEDWKDRRDELNELVRTLQRELDPEEAAGVPAVIDQVVSETPYSEQAATRLKSILRKVGKPAYDLTIKVIGDVGAATVKKMLGL